MTNQIKKTLIKNSEITGSANFAALIKTTQNTSKHEIDEALSSLQASKDNWVQLGVRERITILGKIIQDMATVKNLWVNSELRAKEIKAKTLGEAEEWGLVAVVVRALRIIRNSLIDILKNGQPKISGPIKTRSNGQVVASVFPLTFKDRIVFRGITAQVWMEPDVTVKELSANQAKVYNNKDHKGKVALVLGAGNASMLPVIDFLHKLFVEDQVVVLKLNPVNAHLGPLIEEGFRALIGKDYLRIVYGGIKEGSYLANHPAVEELHLTGSDKTYDSIVFGPGHNGERRKADHAPLISKRFTGELGNVSPVIVVPGPWSKSDISAQAVQIATWQVMNAGFACLAPRVIVQHKSWSIRNELLRQVGEIFNQVDTRIAYYPGAKDRHATFLASHPNSQQFGSKSGDHLPWTIIPDVDPDNDRDICFKQEAFCSLFAETAIEAPNIQEFIEQAVEFANQTLWGTLNATLIVHPKSLKDPLILKAVDQAVANLRYGTVAINMFPFYSAYLMVCPWGGFPRTQQP
ncbi:aldehyde dehydrogenase family protein [Thermodesulfobacteriota bacterium]